MRVRFLSASPFSGVKVQIVESKGKDSCGVCALALFLDITWEEAAELIWPGKWKERCSFSTLRSDLISALKRHGKYRFVKAKAASDWSKIPKNSFVRIDTPTFSQPFLSHWVVWDGTYIYDNNLKKRATPKQHRWWTRPFFPLSVVHYFTVKE